MQRTTYVWWLKKIFIIYKCISNYSLKEEHELDGGNAFCNMMSNWIFIYNHAFLYVYAYSYPDAYTYAYEYAYMYV